MELFIRHALLYLGVDNRSVRKGNSLLYCVVDVVVHSTVCFYFPNNEETNQKLLN